jgi:hypothetical protein
MMVRNDNALRVLSETAAAFQAQLSDDERALLATENADDTGASIVYAADERDQALADFELLAAVDAAEALARDIRAFCDRRLEEAYRSALEVYYTAEELARDPEHAELVVHVEAMRRAHLEQYGRAIPPRVVGG